MIKYTVIYKSGENYYEDEVLAINRAHAIFQVMTWTKCKRGDILNVKFTTDILTELV